MAAAHLNIVDLSGSVVTESLAFMALSSSEEAKYKNFHVTNGYGKLMRVGVEVSGTASVSVTVDLDLNLVTDDQLDTLYNKYELEISEIDREKLVDIHRVSGSGGRFLGLFSVIYGGSGSYEHFKDKTNEHFETKNELQDKVTRELHDMYNRAVKVKGTLTVESTSHIPSRAAIFVETTHIVFADGKRITVVNTNNPVAANEDGDTSGVQVQSGNLNVVPLDPPVDPRVSSLRADTSTAAMEAVMGGGAEGEGASRDSALQELGK